jgi:hypothetical protein
MRSRDRVKTKLGEMRLRTGRKSKLKTNVRKERSSDRGAKKKSSADWRSMRSDGRSYS